MSIAAKSSAKSADRKSVAARSDVETPRRAEDGAAASLIGNQQVQGLLAAGIAQAKLAVGRADDPLEAEADRVADAAMRASAPVCACGGTCDKCNPRAPRQVQRRGNGDAELGNATVADHITGSLGSGRPLDPAARAFFEPRLGHDFGRVRVHADARADAAARSVDALAFTVGRDIAFAAGQYVPGTQVGRRLLAHELAHVAQQGAATALTPARKLQRSPIVLRRQPTPVPNRNQLCYRPGMAPPGVAGECDARVPANCPTYEQWIATFRRLRTFHARDTAPGGVHPIDFLAFGDQPATRPVDTPQPATPAPPPAPIGPRVADRFIDHPTDTWVRNCLPDNLRETAYRLPTDCADVAIILRHVWLSAHHRTERYGDWLVGDAAGRARVDRAAGLIGPVASANAARMLNPYSDDQGQPLRTFAALQGLLHPGDILVWAHHDAGLGTARTGGDVETIMQITRSAGVVTRIDVIQGDQPIFDEQAAEIRAFIGRRAPSAFTLQHSPGRRIELHNFSGSDLRDLPLPLRRGQATPTRVWTQADGDSTIVAAGPPAAAARPGTRRIGGVRQRRISDWLSSLRSASTANLTGRFEAALLELRALIEGGQGGLDADAASLGTAAGERLWRLAATAGDLGEESHFRPLLRLREVIMTLGNPAGASGSAVTPRAAEVRRVFDLIDAAFHLAARGATEISFTRRVGRGTTVIRVLVTGFDPFVGTAAVPPGVFNPSGAAALILDNTTVSAGRGVIAAVESVVLPVNFGDFRRGIVENIVRPLVRARGVDAVLTVSLDESIVRLGAVRFERFVVGVHNERGRPEAVPAAPGGGGLGEAIVETPAPLAAIAADTEQTTRRGRTVIPRPTIGVKTILDFPSAGAAQRAAAALGLPAPAGATLEVDDAGALQRIIASMRRAPNGSDIEFQLGSDRFTATVVEGPGGSFLSNEVSYRVLRLLREEQRTDITSFHTHVPRALPTIGARIPQATNTRAARRARSAAIVTAQEAVRKLVATLRRVIASVARRIAAARAAASGRSGTTP